MRKKISRTTKHATSGERSLEIALCRLAQDVDGDKFGVVKTLDPHERLDEQWLRVAER